jgi:non-heme chloroperoxidase
VHCGFSETNFRPDLERIDVPALIIHGDDDQIVPFDVGAGGPRRSSEALD